MFNLKYITSIIFILFLSSCSKPQEPQFIKIDEIEAEDMSMENVTLNSKLHYHNPNAIGATVKSTDILVTINDISIGNVKQTSVVSIEKSSDFEVPVSISFPPKKILGEENLLKSVLQLYSNSKVKVHYKGTMTFTVAGFDFDIPIDYLEEIPLKK